MQSDPIGLRGGTNTFNYVVSDPMFSYDDDGLSKRTKKCCGLSNPARWKQLQNDPNLPKHVKGWIKNQIRQGGTFKVPPGYDLAHMKGCENDCGFGFEYANPMLHMDHVIQHRYWRKRKERWTLAIPKTCGRKKPNLPK